ncbi:Uncharacterized protein DAT39_000170 [Clarias magur]|uniref:Uncharacterized protein n=1 Tax=Clarias magur TaxID=1594786 RepID=A0A8J5BNU9_CLAMG|nr:Uncharacterized protein DAT39_000170 [Clarias magur]
MTVKALPWQAEGQGRRPASVMTWLKADGLHREPLLGPLAPPGLLSHHSGRVIRPQRQTAGSLLPAARHRACLPSS